MNKIFSKIFRVPSTVIPLTELDCSDDILLIGEKIQSKVQKLFHGSLAIREVDAGSSNAEEQELTALTNPYYDVERFGVHFVASPRHADMLFVTGPVTRSMAEALRRTYDATPSPKIVVAIGDGAINGGVFKGSYATHDGVSNIIPVNFSIAGDPPSPKHVLCGLLKIIDRLDSMKLMCD